MESAQANPAAVKAPAAGKKVFPKTEMSTLLNEIAELEKSFKNLSQKEKQHSLEQFVETINDKKRIHQVQNTEQASNAENEHHLISESFSALIRDHNLDFSSLASSYADDVGHKIGCGSDLLPLLGVKCANADVLTNVICKNPGTRRCGQCEVVTYCSRECQVKHWKFHKAACTQEIAKKDWVPDYMKECRPAAFIRQPANFTSFGSRLDYLWGNVPAFDYVKLLDCEISPDNPLKFLFAASGDLRNIVNSVANLPDNLTTPIHVYINDHEPKIAARNFAMLTLLAKKGTSAIDSVIQFWYSSAVTSNQIFFLLKELSALVADTKRSSKYSKTTIHSLFDKNLWKSLGRMLTSRFSIYDADQSRRHVMLNPSRTDYLHRYMSGLKPGERVCCDNFRRYGLLLPFGALNAHLNVANRLIMDPDFGWTMTDSSDPLSGWDLKQVASTGKKYKVPPQDHYGALFFHIRDRLELFVKKLEKLTIEFHLTCMDACVLASDLSAENVVFDRIDVSNICDEQYVGIDRVLKSFCPLLNPKNSSAALTTLFMNWMREVPKHHINNTMIEIMKTFKKQKLNPMEIMAKATELATQAADEAAIKYNHTADFNKYIKKSDLLAASLGYKRRAVNKILPKRLYGSMQANKQDADLDMTAEDMHLVHVTMSTMFERFAEWEKA